MTNASPGLSAAQTLTACAECDQLLRAPANTHSRLACPICGAAQTALESFEPVKPLAIALTGLVLAIPANIYPQLSFSLLGQPNYYTLTGGALHLVEQGFFWVGALILGGTVIVPLLVLLLIIAATGAWLAGFAGWRIAPLLKIYHHLVNWIMLDVYLLSVIVSMVKLRSMGDLVLTQGFYCFVLMMLATSAAVMAFKTGPFWDLLELRQHARN